MFTFNDCKEALEAAGPKLKEEILQRAVDGPDISFWDYVRLHKLAHPGTRGA